MDGNGPLGNGKDEMDSNKSVHIAWNMMARQHIMKEQNQIPANKKIIETNKKIEEACAERDVAIRDRNIAVLQSRVALLERDAAREERDKAIDERNSALIERDNAILTLQIYGHYNSTRESPITNALPISTVMSPNPRPCSTKPTNQEKGSSWSEPDSDPPMDLNVDGYSIGVKSKFEREDQNVGSNMISFDESTMSAPVCSCTGVPRRCAKAGNGAWQSACCTTTISSYPLPYNKKSKRRARISGRKMSGAAFSRLLTQSAEAGQGLSSPMDLKDHWARQGTNGRSILK